MMIGIALVLAALVGTGTETNPVWRAAVDTVHAEDSMEVFAWTYYSYNNVTDEAQTVADWKDLGVNAPLSPRVDGATDKAKFRAFLDRCFAAGVRPYVYDTRIADLDNILAIIGEDLKGAERYRKLVREVVADWGNHPAVRGFYVADEPEAKHNAAVFLAARIQREEAPALSPFLNLLPWFDWIGERMGAKTLAEYLDRAKRESGLATLGYDCYMQQQNGYADKDLDVYFDNLREWAEFGKRSGVKWNTTLLCVPHYEYVLGSSDDFRWQISTAAAMGAKGISWFFPDMRHGGRFENYRDAPINVFGERTPAFSWMSTETRAFLHQFSRELLRLEWDESFCVGKTYGGIPAFKPTAELLKLEGENVLASRFHDAAGGIYYAVVNLARHDPKSVSLTFAPELAVEERGWNGWRELVSPPDAVAAKQQRGPQSVWRPCAPGQLYLFRVSSSAISQAAVSPRIILDSERLDYPSWPESQIEKLNSGWKREGKDFVRPFNRQAPGTVRYGGGFSLPVGVTAELKFVDGAGKVLKSEHIAGGAEAKVCGTFSQQGELAALRLEPSREIPPLGVFSKPLRVTVDWAVDEPFTYLATGGLPAGWQGVGAKVKGLPYLGCAAKDGRKGFDAQCSDAVLEITPGGSVEPVVSTELLTGDYAFEFDFFAETNSNVTAAGVELNSLYRFTPGIWYHLRFEVSRGKARVRLNGRVGAERVAVKGFALVNRSKTVPLLIDDVKAFALVSPSDYPPAPIRPNGEEKWEVMLNVCPLWHNGYHVGWGCIERGNGPKLVLGYYDEGLPETADWEIKYLVEHGVDVQAFCWYPETHDGPIRHPRYEFHLRDGFKNARYSSAMKYCLIWEIENAGRPHSLEAWKRNYVPYLIEHHFKDPRYYVVDGKPVLMVFGGWNFPDSTTFGSAEVTKAAFDYLGEELKKLGFKGVLPIFSHGDSHADYVAPSGFEAATPYGYGYDGWKLETQKERNLARAKDATVFEIPAVSVGFNSEPWHGKAYPMMSPEDFRRSLKWVRDEFIPSQKHANTWQSKVVLLSNWNEYGEGTYLMPTEDERGFGYLDALRSVFTDEAPDPKLNQRPTPAQKARICHLYPSK